METLETLQITKIVVQNNHSVMEHVKELLDTSTIHGFSWISSTKRFAKFFWILVVIGGFTGAGYLIHTSFDDWAQSPITTTIETLSITRITFPNITICPPKTLSLNLNYDILQSEKKKLDKDKNNFPFLLLRQLSFD